MPHGNDCHGEVSDTQVVENQIVMFCRRMGRHSITRRMRQVFVADVPQVARSAKAK